MSSSMGSSPIFYENGSWFHGGGRYEKKTITPSHGKYAFRFTLTFANGTVISKERGGYATRKQCQLDREQAVTELNNHEYVTSILRDTLLKVLNSFSIYYGCAKRSIRICFFHSL